MATLPPLIDIPSVPPPLVPINDESIDKKTGAPLDLRAVIAAYPKPEDKLRLLKKYYPDVQPYGSDNFVFTSKTGRKTLFNPQGMDIGDIAEYGRIIPEIGGGIVGGMVGVPGGPAGVVGGGIAGSQLAGELYDSMMRAFGGVEETRTAGEQATDIMKNVGIDVATLGAGKYVLRPAAKALGFGSKAGQEAAASAQRLGMKPLPAGAVGGKTTQVIEGGLGQTLGGAATVAGTYQQAVQELGDVIKRVGNEAAGANPAAAGQLIIDAANNFQKRFQTRSGELYERVGDLMPKGQVFDAPNTQQIIKDLQGAGFDSPALAEALQDKKTIKILEAIFNPEGKVSYNDLKRVRTRMGDLLKDKPAFGMLDATSADIRRIYGALSKDMDASAMSVGGEVAEAASRASKFFRVGMETIENKINPLVTQGGQVLDPQKVYERVSAGTRKQMATTEQQLGQFVPPSSRRAVGVAQLGQMAGETASPAKIVSGLEKARMGTGRLPSTLQNVPGIQDIETVASALKQGASRTNFSNTAGGLGVMSLLGAGVGGAVTGDIYGAMTGFGAQVAAPLVIAQALRIPAVRRILTDTTTDTMRKYAALTALGLNAPIAQALVEQPYNTDSGLMGMMGK